MYRSLDKNTMHYVYLGIDSKRTEVVRINIIVLFIKRENIPFFNMNSSLVDLCDDMRCVMMGKNMFEKPRSFLCMYLANAIARFRHDVCYEPIARHLPYDIHTAS